MRSGAWAHCLLLLAGCRPNPVALAEDAVRALEAGDRQAIELLLHPAYSDPLGAKAETVAALAELFERFPRRQVRFEAVELLRGEPLSLSGVEHVELTGAHTVKWVGPFRWELERDGWPLRVRSGFLDALRDVQGLLEARRAALEANDAEGYGRLLHPDYRDGDLDRAGALSRIAEDLDGVVLRYEPIHHQAERRQDLVHVDERYSLRVGEQAFPRGLARLTLRSALGRWRIAAGLYAPEGSGR